MKKMRIRILAAFSCVLFFSFAITAAIFNVVIRLLMYDSILPYPYAQNVERGLIGRIGLTQLVLVGVMFVVALIVTYFLSNSITRPIEKLSDYASKIGPGNFESNDFQFDDAELAGLNSALNKTVTQLSAYDNEQKTFFQNASHELRTPLMSIKCYAEGISFGLMEPKAAADTILAEADKLTELVADLLTISKIDNLAADYAFVAASLEGIIAESISRHQALAEKQQLRFVLDFDSNTELLCIPDLMARAIDNLISNALRYAKSEIRISCRMSAIKATIVVADDGDGIEEQTLPHVFERFYKGRGGNTGVGLAIVKSIIDQHGGTIRAENRATESSGAVFTLTLPRRAEA